MWLYLVLTPFLTIAGMAAVLVMMWFQADTRSQLILSLASAAVVVVAWLARDAWCAPGAASRQRRSNSKDLRVASPACGTFSEFPTSNT